MTPIEIIVTLLGTLGALFGAWAKIDTAHQKNRTDTIELGVNTLKASNEDLRSERDSLQTDNRQLRNDREHLVTTLRDTLDLNHDLQSLQKETASQVAQLRTDLDKAIKDRAELQSMVDVLRGALDEQRVSHAAEISRYLDQTEKRISNLESTIIELRADIKDKERTIAELVKGRAA